MSSFICLPLISLAAVCLVMLLVWVWAMRIDNAGVVDVFWAFNFTVIAGIVLTLSKGNEWRRWLVCVLAIVWSLRLTFHLGKRVLMHLDDEEGRYKQLRKEWNHRLALKLFLFFQAQAFSNVWLAFPFFIIANNNSSSLSWLEVVGAIVWFLSIIGEAIADRQLRRFREHTANHGKVCNAGLWHYSRHPNYFFQLMIWIGVFLFALNSDYGWMAMISPLTVAYLLFKVTGIPLTEEQAIRTRGDAYRHYQQTTSVFIPWFPKTK